MYTIFIRTNSTNFQLNVDSRHFNDTVHMLEDSNNVIKFKVTDGEHLLYPQHFGMGDFTKWSDKLYE